MRVKICGVNAPDAFDAAVAACADWVGFVFFARSPRFVTASQAAALAGRAAAGPAVVGLFVEPANDEIARVLDRLRLDALQLYASPTRIDEIAETFALPVWRSVAVASSTDLPDAAGAEAVLVVEAGKPPGADRPGGNAAQLDWRLLGGWQAPLPWLLAGGLDPGNVARAIAQSGATAVDVSSGVESAPGVKEAGLITAFVAAARAG